MLKTLGFFYGIFYLVLLHIVVANKNQNKEVNEMKLEDYLKDSVIHGYLKRLMQKAKTLKAKNFPNDEEVKTLLQGVIQRVQILGAEVGKRKVLSLNNVHNLTKPVFMRASNKFA